MHGITLTVLLWHRRRKPRKEAVHHARVRSEPGLALRLRRLFPWLRSTSNPSRKT